jgi:tRNA(Ile)-lysidine synthase
MLLEFEKKVTDFLASLKLQFTQGDILIAVSGGADSIALLYCLQALKSENIITENLYCSHINHQLRHDADSDEQFVISQAQRLNIPVITKRLDIKKFANDNKMSIETAARQLRIENLIEIAKTNKCTWIATGHQKNDNAETIIHRLLRGTGFRGLAGIWPVRKFNENVSFIRPLLCVTRDEIIRYLLEKNLKWHEDYTNAELIYTRNHIRHRLLPALQKQCKNSLIEQLSELSSKAGSLYKQICNKADTIWPEVSIRSEVKVILKIDIFQYQSVSVMLELLRRALAHIGCGERDITSEHYKKILQIAEQNTSRKKLQLPGGFLIQKEYENIVFTRRVGLAPPFSSRSKLINGGVEPHSTTITIPDSTIFNDFTIQASFIEMDQTDFKKFLKSKTHSIEWFDYYKIKTPLIIRFRKNGDRFIPLGQKAEKKIGKFLTDQKVSDEIRNKILIIEDSEKIIWLYPIRISEETKITSQTRKILQLQINQTKMPVINPGI